MSVSRAQEEISAAEFAAWQAFYNVEPFGEEFADYRNALLCSIFASAHSDQSYAPKDFMWNPETEQATPEQQMTALAHQARMFNKARKMAKK